MSQYLIDQIKLTPNIQILTNSEITEVKGTNRLEKLILQRKDKNETEERDACALFIFIGAFNYYYTLFYKHIILFKQMTAKCGILRRHNDAFFNIFVFLD